MRENYRVCTICKSRTCEHLRGVVTLSLRERRIIGGLTRGLTNREIAAENGIAVETVKQYMHHIFAKLRLQTRLEVALWGRDNRALWENGTS